MSEENHVVLKDVWKVYKTGKVEWPALRGVNLSVRRKTLTMVIGPSGSGKSTLLNIIGGLDKPTSGSVFVNNVDISKLNGRKLADYRNNHVGFVFQSYNLLNYLTVFENVELPLIIKGVPHRERKELVLKMLDMLGLKGMEFKRPLELSGGEQQRVAIARALVNAPNLILADEPTGNLDSKNAQIVVEVFKNLVVEHGKTVLMVTHNVELTRYADVIVKMRDGNVVEVVGD
ncbi:MAG: ABC transporter ATP-binding protein [Sulfolobales archaeon]